MKVSRIPNLFGGKGKSEGFEWFSKIKKRLKEMERMKYAMGQLLLKHWFEADVFVN